jgi:hypothetical protein
MTNITEERKKLSRVHRSPKWKKKVEEMAPKDVVDILARLNAQGKV